MAYKVYAPMAKDRELSRIRSYRSKEAALKRITLLRSFGHSALLIKGFNTWTFNRPVSHVFA